MLTLAVVVSARRRGGAAPERGHKKPRFRGIVSSVRCHLSLISLDRLTVVWGGW